MYRDRSASSFVTAFFTIVVNASGEGAHVGFYLGECGNLIRLYGGYPEGVLLDTLDIAIDCYSPDPALLSADHRQPEVGETLYSHLLKSNCLVTGQPDWGMLVVRYQGAPIDREGLLRYIVSFRQHNEFHEQCVERVFVDILRQCQPTELSVWARYTRRGGLDINPCRRTPGLPAPASLAEVRQ